MAPKTHNLTYLAELGQVQLTEEQREFIAILDAAGTTTRYPKDLRVATKEYPRRVVTQYLKKTREVLECIKKDPALNGS